MGHGEVGAEHLLLGLLSEQHDGVGELLADAGLSVHAVRELVRERVRAETEASLGQDPVFSPQAKDALRSAHRFAMGEPGPAHILIALVARGENGACEILRLLGADPGMLRFEAKKLLAGVTGPDGLRTTSTGRPMLPELDFGD
jgi:ATP-dependent Clp protease ATP-binding subunit ClpC